MRHEHQRHVLFTVNPNDQFEDEACVFAVEVAGGFVREQDGRAIGQAAGDGNALPFSARQLGGEMVEAMPQSNRLQQGDGSISPLRTGKAAFKHRNLYILQRGKGWQQVKRLENEADLESAIARRIMQDRESSFRGKATFP